MGFWGSLFGGQNKALDKAVSKTGQAADFSSGLGEGLVSKSANWISDLMSGDPTKTSQLLAPKTSEVRQRAQQGKQNLAQFGTRSGGTAGAAASIDASTRGDINNMIASLTGSAIGEGMNAGRGLLDSGMNYLNQQVNFSQQQMENWSNSIAGMSITSGIAAAEAFATGGAGG